MVYAKFILFLHRAEWLCMDLLCTYLRPTPKHLLGQPTYNKLPQHVLLLVIHTSKFSFDLHYRQVWTQMWRDYWIPTFNNWPMAEVPH